MNPVNATTYPLEDDLRRDAAPPRPVRQSAEAAELAWMLRGSQGEMRETFHEGEASTPRASAAALAPVNGAAAASYAPAPLEPEEPSLPKRDWSSALDLVQEACEAIRISEERVLELERQNQQTAHQAREDIKALQLQVQAGERRAQAADARAVRAEARAQEAESWLMRLHDAISMGFGRVAKSGER